MTDAPESSRDPVDQADASLGSRGVAAGGTLDRCSVERTAPDVRERLLAEAGTRVLPICRGRVPVLDGPLRLGFRAPQAADLDRPSYFLGRLLGREGDVAVLAVEVENAPDEWLTARAVGSWLPRVELDILLTTMALSNWHRSHPRCSRCGRTTRVVSGGWARHCDFDDSEHYPRTDPAVIMSVVDADDRLLLARNAAWDANRRSVLAGFVEPGERLEDAVAREVFEEVGVRVTDVVYVGNQPWPFPSSLMLGYEARVRQGDEALIVDRTEIVQADWYTREKLAEHIEAGRILLPTRMSIARRLIERWFGAALATGEQAPVVGR